MKKVLFICRYHQGRSPMAEAFLKKYGEGNYEAYSAGYEEREIRPEVMEIMKEKGFDLSKVQKKSLQEYIRNSEHFGYVISLCDRNEEKDCPVYPGTTYRENWNIPAPEYKTGSEEEIRERARVTRDEIEKPVLDFIERTKNV